MVATTIATLPANSSNPIDALVGDPNGAGVWFWDLTATGDVIYHVSGTGKLTAYPIFTGTSVLYQQGSSGLAVGTNGMVWLGINTTLAELNPDSGKVQTWSIPAGQANPRQQPASAEDMAGHRAVNALAVGPKGQVAIAMNSESSVEVFDPPTATFSTLKLPVITDKPISVTYSGDGSLCVGMSNIATGGHANELLLVQPGGTTAHATVPDGTAWEVAPYDASTFVVGSFDPHLVASDGAVTPLLAPKALTGTASAPTPLRLLPNGKLLGVADNGLLEFPSTATSVSAVTTQTSTLTVSVACQPAVSSFRQPATPQPTPTPYPPGYKCLEHYGDINAVDGAGNIWIVSKDAQAGVAMVEPKG
ncbi:MAG TPA: hypothetical protein VKU87_11790 [Thermomicrobiaceae bacterium]|nr:hypothetical protein [Thermomicrobiaceae bacterium]